MGRAVAFVGMLLGERGVLTKASLFRTRPNHVHTYFIKYPAAGYATPKTDENLTRLSPHVTARLAVPTVPISYSKQYSLRKVTGLQNFLLRHFSAVTTFPGAAVSRIRMKLAVKDSLHLFSPMKVVDFRCLV